MLTPIEFTTSLSERLEKGVRVLPLFSKDEAALKALVPDGEYTFLTIRDLVGAEIVKVENTCDTLLVTRAQDGTSEKTFPKGSCVRFEMTPAVVKELICTHNCCEGECPCEPVKAAGFVLPAATKTLAWQGSAVFTGDLPMELAVTGAPSWVKMTLGPNFVAFEGTPPAAGTFVISVAATNCSGEVAVQQGTLTIA